jgi:hypothetical protein
MTRIARWGRTISAALILLAVPLLLVIPAGLAFASNTPWG